MTEQLVTVTEADHGRRIEVAPGGRLVLRLHEIGGTGYLWTFEDLDASLVEARQDPIQRQDGVGGGGDVQWTITAKSKGVTELRLRLWRHWEGERSVRRRFSVTLSIRD